MSIAKRLKERMDASTGGADDLKEIFSMVGVFLNEFNRTLAEGSDEEKRAILEEFLELRQDIDEVVTKTSQDLDMDEETLKKALEQPGVYKESEWDVMQDAKKELDEIVGETPDLTPKKSVNQSKAKKSKSRGRKKPWLRS